MLLRHITRVYHNFAKLQKPNLSKYSNLFDLMRDRSDELKNIDSYNQQHIHTYKNYTIQHVLQKNLNIPEDVAKDILKNTRVRAYSYSPIFMNPYRITQEINNQIQVEDTTDEIEGLYRPGHINLKYHYSINKDVPNLQQYHINKQIIYLFNLPKNATESFLYKQIERKFPQKAIKIMVFKYCMLGLPAYAQLQFPQQFESNKLSELITFLSNKNILVITDTQKQKLPLHRRQLVIKGIPQLQTPASMLEKLSAYGRILNLNLPMQTYKHQSLKQIKQLYKKQQAPIKLNYYRQNGTIQSEYYPPFQPLKQQVSIFAQKQDEYNRRLRYCQNVNVYEGKEGTIETRAKGFCIVTFSCQEEAQHCYFHLRNFFKMELLNGKQQFQFDQKHYEALLRFIDNSYIQQCKANDPYSNYNNVQEKMDSPTFQSVFLTLVHQRMQKNYYKPKKQSQQSSSLSQQDQLKLFMNYKQYLNKLHDSIGMNNFNQSYDQQLNSFTTHHQNNMYGKSFDELAEQQLFSMKLKQNQNAERYQVDIDDFIYPQKQPELHVRKIQQRQPLQEPDDPLVRKDLHSFTDQDLYQGGKELYRNVKKMMRSKREINQANMSIGKFRKRKEALKKRLENWSQIKKNYKAKLYSKQSQQSQQDFQQNDDFGEQQQLYSEKLHKQQQQQLLQHQQQNQQQPPQKPVTKIQKKFSTMRDIKKQYRHKTFQQKIISHMRYNKFVRNTINQYMGIFPTDKLSAEFHKKKPNFVNPQSLKFINGEDFLLQDEVAHVLQYTNKQAQQHYNKFFIQNQLTKSLNINIEQSILSHMQQNMSKTLYHYCQVGAIKQQYIYTGKEIQKTLKKLNIEAKIGQQYKIVSKDDGNKAIAKISKIEHIFPLDLYQKFKNINEYIQKQLDNEKEKMINYRERQKQKQRNSQIKYKNNLQKQQQNNIQKQQQNNIQKQQQYNNNKQQSIQQQHNKFIQFLCTKFNITKKDYQKLVNLKNYSQQQIIKDIQTQILISHTKNKFQQKKASDFNKDPSEIKVKDKDDLSVVSKFRQI